MSRSNQWQNLDGIGSGDGSEPPDGTSSSFYQRAVFDPLWTPEQVGATECVARLGAGSLLA